MTVNGLDYFAPLSSFKEKHKKMKNNIDFLKVGNYAVINLNNMFPVPKSQCIYVDISKESDPSYKALLSAEYRIITSLTERILKNAKSLYEYKMKNGNSTPLAKRCNDFKLLDNNGQLLKNIENVTDENGNWIATCNYEVQRINK